jgi:nicotinate-nucleotide--dimethylbenzimidazole phosphoribosyltransferase
VCGGGATTSRTVTQSAVDKKIAIVSKALARHPDINSPMDALCRVGGCEIAAMVGAILEASQRELPVLVDGFVVTAAALVAVSLSPAVCRVLLWATQSSEPGQSVALDAIHDMAVTNGVIPSAQPVLNMSLRMGEATGALMAVPVLRSAAATMNDMGTIVDILSEG